MELCMRSTGTTEKAVYEPQKIFCAPFWPTKRKLPPFDHPKNSAPTNRPPLPVKYDSYNYNMFIGEFFLIMKTPACRTSPGFTMSPATGIGIELVTSNWVALQWSVSSTHAVATMGKFSCGKEGFWWENCLDLCGPGVDTNGKIKIPIKRVEWVKFWIGSHLIHLWFENPSTHSLKRNAPWKVVFVLRKSVDRCNGLCSVFHDIFDWGFLWPVSNSRDKIRPRPGHLTLTLGHRGICICVPLSSEKTVFFSEPKTKGSCRIWQGIALLLRESAPEGYFF